MDAHHQPFPCVGTLGFDEVVAAVHKGKSPCVAGRFGGIGMAEGDCRVVGVAGDAPHTANALDAAAQRRTFRGALRCPCTVQGDQFESIRRKVESQRSRLVQGQLLGRGVGINCRAGDEVLGFVDAVPQFHGQTARIFQENGKRLHPLSIPEHRQVGQLGFADMHFSTVEHERRRFRAVGVFRDDGGSAVISGAAAGKLLRQKIRPAAGVAVGHPGIRKAGHILRQTGAVISVQHHAIRGNCQLVAGVGGMQGKDVFGADDHCTLSSVSGSSSGSSSLRPAFSS